MFLIENCLCLCGCCLKGKSEKKQQQHLFNYYLQCKRLCEHMSRREKKTFSQFFKNVFLSRLFNCQKNYLQTPDKSFASDPLLFYFFIFRRTLTLTLYISMALKIVRAAACARARAPLTST